MSTLADLARQASSLGSLLEHGSKNSKPLYLPIAPTPISSEHAHSNTALFMFSAVATTSYVQASVSFLPACLSSFSRHGQLRGRRWTHKPTGFLDVEWSAGRDAPGLITPWHCPPLYRPRVRRRSRRSSRPRGAGHRSTGSLISSDLRISRQKINKS